MNDKNLLTIGEAAKFLGVSIMTLRRWGERGTLKPFRPSPLGHRYYRKSDLELMINDLATMAKNWTTASFPTEPPPEFYCQTKDVFEARITRLQNELLKIPHFESKAPLIVSASGEIGNNSFDHNLGAWPDISGIFFAYDLMKKKIALSDRGQGLLATLKRVRPLLKNDTEAINTAFTEIVSARAPEARGNGLKYVRKVISENSFSLLFQSGNSELKLANGTGRLEIEPSGKDIRGCYAVVSF